MRKILGQVEVIFWFTVIWIILHESIGWLQILTGIIVSMLTLLITEKYFLRAEYYRTYRIETSVLFRYGLYLLTQIYRSGFTAIGRIIRGQSRVIIDNYQSQLEDDYSLCLLANAVTLTPGTVTVDKQGTTLKILSFVPEDAKDECILDSVCGQFEKILMRRNSR